ncbi:MAG TPA: hypothetical protein VEA80_14440 [Vitreimonas sp.]|uniref:hypothetical protein n=1 Tax=Vitreimonas sp. TaxID=3069702 RepID=UPI002D4AAB66|nr:hypothetical protein [Vitreimonas sp.]HYD88669.1 hypothetical protein [Vitreimonas sp.]
MKRLGPEIDQAAVSAAARRKLAERVRPWYDRATAAAAPLGLTALLIALFLKRREILALFQ